VLAEVRFRTVLCALLGTPEHGRWLIEAAEPNVRLGRGYRDGTLILETRFETTAGAVTVIDFMPPRGRNSDILWPRHRCGRSADLRAQPA
jgi:hypothetical protein